jgi:hypothetical protein
LGLLLLVRKEARYFHYFVDSYFINLYNEKTHP